MQEHQYLIVDEHDVVWFVNAINSKAAVTKYADSVAISIKRDLFNKLSEHLKIEELIVLFNDVCVGTGDKIKYLLSDFKTLYKRSNNNAT